MKFKPGKRYSQFKARNRRVGKSAISAQWLNNVQKELYQALSAAPERSRSTDRGQHGGGH